MVIELPTNMRLDGRPISQEATARIRSLNGVIKVYRDKGWLAYKIIVRDTVTQGEIDQVAYWLDQESAAYCFEVRHSDPLAWLLLPLFPLLYIVGAVFAGATYVLGIWRTPREFMEKYYGPEK